MSACSLLLLSKSIVMSNRARYKTEKRLYNIEEASVYLGRSVWALREMLWAGKIPFVKDGRRILLDIRDMEIWIEKNKTQFTF